MRRALRPLLIPLLRRAPDEVERQLAHFSVSTDEGRTLVKEVGRAFLQGYHAMLAARALSEVRAAGAAVPVHFAPFFFEGAAMGYLPRAYYTEGSGRARAEADLVGMDPRFLYLYYVGLGFWHGFRHAGNPGSLEALAPHLDPLYFPLCYDGFGFKLGFFDAPQKPAVRDALAEAPAIRRGPLYQGFGRALFFVCMHDEARFQREKAQAPAEHRGDVESGRSLATAFTELREPDRIVAHLAAAADDDERGSRLLGVTWALTARELNDPEYFTQCLASAPPDQRALLSLLPQRCREALAVSRSYEEWRAKTRAAVADAYVGGERVRRS